MAKMTPSCRNESTAFSSALGENASSSFAPDGAGVEGSGEGSGDGESGG